MEAKFEHRFIGRIYAPIHCIDCCEMLAITNVFFHEEIPARRNLNWLIEMNAIRQTNHSHAFDRLFRVSDYPPYNVRRQSRKIGSIVSRHWRERFRRHTGPTHKMASWDRGITTWLLGAKMTHFSAVVHLLSLFRSHSHFQNISFCFVASHNFCTSFPSKSAQHLNRERI